MTPTRVSRFFLALAALLAAGCPLAQRNAPVEPRQIAPRGALLADEQHLIRLFEATAPSVAYITTQVVARRGFFVAEVAQGAGSGFVWDDKGHVVTNNHVVEGAQKVQVQLDAGRTYDARVVGTAPQYDLAVVKLEQVPPGLKPLALGTSKDLRIGQSAYAIGVTTAIRSPSGGSTGVGLAIPVDLVNRIVPQLIAKGRAPQPGIGIVPVDPELVARAGVVGVVIAQVQRGSPAAQAGLKAATQQGNNVDLGDVIVAVNGRAVESLTAFISELDRVGIDQAAELTVIREGRERRVKVKVVDVLAR